MNVWTIVLISLLVAVFLTWLFSVIFRPSSPIQRHETVEIGLTYLGLFIALFFVLLFLGTLANRSAKMSIGSFG